ncbi:MAG: gamma-glutamyltransferase [Chloroflexota bacterium]
MKGMVVCPQPRAAEAGARVLEAGGNAFDAALATAFMQMVVDPFMCGPGGMGTANIYVAATRENAVIDFFNRAGSKVRPDLWLKDLKGYSPLTQYYLFEDHRNELGYTSVMTPGTIAGLAEINKNYGMMKWGDLIAPAIGIARDGFQVPHQLVFMLNKPAQPAVSDMLMRVKANKACSQIYLRPDGRSIQPGNRLVNRDMAHTLEVLADEGPDSFYHGSLACIIAEDFAANGGDITAEDLANYRPRKSKPVSTTYRGHTVISNLPPGGGACVIELLNILEGFELGKLEHNGIEHLDILARAMLVTQSDRDKYLGDPDFVSVPLETVFLSKEYAQEQQKMIKENIGKTTGTPIREEGTTNLCVVDEMGNTIAMTHTLGSSSGVVTPGLGFMYNNSMKQFNPVQGKPNSLVPGKARLTGMCPSIVFKDGKPAFVVGAPGGNVIISSVLQSICNVIDWGMTALEAVSVPRIHRDADPLVYVDAEIREDICEELRQRGHQVAHQIDSFSAAMISRSQVIRVLPDGRLDGGSDPRGAYAGVARSRG